MFFILVGGLALFGFIVLVGLPRLIGYSIGKAIGSSITRSGQAATELSLRQATALQASEFQPDKLFFGGEGGIAFDTTRKLVFISSRLGKQEQGKIYPLGKVLKFQGSTQTNERGFEFYFMDLTVNDIDKPSWRVGFGRDEHLALQAGAMFELLWARA